MIKSHAPTLTMKAWPNCQKNVGLFVWSFPSSAYFISGALTWDTQQWKPSAARRELFSFSSCNFNGFKRFLSSWFLLKISWSLPMNTNTSPSYTQTHTHTFTKSNYIHLLFHYDIVDSLCFCVHCHYLHKHHYHNLFLYYFWRRVKTAVLR